MCRGVVRRSNVYQYSVKCAIMRLSFGVFLTELILWPTLSGGVQSSDGINYGCKFCRRRLPASEGRRSLVVPTLTRDVMVGQQADLGGARRRIISCDRWGSGEEEEYRRRLNSEATGGQSRDHFGPKVEAADVLSHATRNARYTTAPDIFSTFLW